MEKVISMNLGVAKVIPTDDIAKKYIEIDGIRVIVKDREIIGWYAPSGLGNTLNDWRDAVHENAVQHGWWEDERSFGEIVALCHSELSEALEEDRAGRPLLYVNGEDGMITDPALFNGCKPEGTAVEMVDCVIRILDWCGRNGVDVEQIMRIKHGYNITRSYKHGKSY